MNFDQELNRMADRYAGQGYQVAVRPGADRLPAFAADFRVELVGVRGREGVLVAVKPTRGELAADADLPRYAEVTEKQPGWRFDIAVLEGDDPTARDFRGAADFSQEEIDRALADAGHIAGLGFAGPAVIAAWAALEAAMRMRLRTAGEKAGWGTRPREMMNELYSVGLLSGVELRRLDELSRLRNQIAHGFSVSATSATSGPEAVRFLSDVARRLVEESQLVEQAV